MYLKSLELLGFKSFAKKTALQFNTPITAIVGPNGSGKSNIAEAFRFVLGEQSVKSMRGKRTEDLIWNGSPELGRSNRASVKLVFDNQKKLLALDFDEVSLERVIYRDASSEYALNGSAVRLRDIVEVLSGAHIGASGHHIISQGEADRILNANMRERREMIEDALGLKVYQWKREESERKLLKTEENMKQVEALRREVAPHLLFLKKQMEKLERVRRQRDELRALYGAYLKREHSYIAEGKKRIAEEGRTPKAELSDLSQKLAAAKRILEKTHGADRTTQAILAIEEKVNGLRADHESLSRELGRIEGELAGAERMRKVGAHVGSDAVLIPFPEVAEVLKRVEGVSDEGDSTLLKEAFKKIRGALKALLERYRAHRNSTAEGLSAEIRALAEKKKEIEKKIGEIRHAEGGAEREERGLREEMDKEKDKSRDAEKEVFRIMARQNELHGTLHALRARQNEVEHAEADFKREVGEGALLAGREILDYEKAAALPEERREVQEERRRQIERLKIRIEDAGGGGGAELQKEFGEATERDQFLARELADLAGSAERLRALIAELAAKLNLEFEEGIAKINREFQNYFSLMFGGGTAKLAVAKPEKKVAHVDDFDAAPTPFEGRGPDSFDDVGKTQAGIDIEVSLPRKKIRGLMMLSGGERALTSIALLFAMSQVKPPPFIILDETDAALDEANSRKYGDMVENLSKHSQLILITHNRETMSRAGVIYGVTMDRSGVSKLLSIAFDEASAVAK